jgi:hypothetical protein
MSNWKIVVSGSVKDFEDDYGFSVQQPLGAGMPPIRNIQTDLAIQDGGLYQRTLAGVRTLTLLGYLSGSSVAALHTLRRDLINVIKPDRTASPEAIELQYTGGTTTVQASAFYDAGLELGHISAFNELNIGLRFVMFDPFFEALTSSSTKLENTFALDTQNFLFYDGDGIWSSASFNDQVNALIFDASANLYIGGDFTTINGSSFPYMAKFDGTDFTAPITTGSKGIKDFAFVGSDLYVTGEIDDINGTTVNGVAKWDGSTWSALGDGMNGDGHALAVDRGGNLYVGGGQSVVDGSLFTGAVSKWDGSAWSLPGNGSAVQSTIEALVVDSNNVLYAAGTGTCFVSVAASFIAKLDSTGSWQAMPGGSVDGSIWGLALGTDGTLFVAGCLTKANEVTVNGIAQHNGTSWQTLTDGTTGSAGVASGSVLTLAVDSNNGILHAGGDFSQVGNRAGTRNFARWTGTTWLRELIEIEANSPDVPPNVLSIAVHPVTGKMAVGLAGSSFLSAPCPVTITNNGTGTVFPIITFNDTTRGGSIYDVVNYTTDTIIETDYTRSPGETVTFDLRENKKTFVSDVAGNIIDSVIPGTQLATWGLAPGDNKVSVRVIYGNTTVSGMLSISERYWSIDT